MFQWTSQYKKKKTQREGITTVCLAYEEFHQGNPPVPTRFLSEMLSLILLENSFQFNLKDYLQTHGTAMGTKMAVAFANIFMAKTEKELIQTEDLLEKVYIDDVISVWDTSRNEIEEFLLQATSILQSNSITAEISETESTFLDTKGTKVSDSTRILSFACEHTSSLQKQSNTCHPPGVTKGFIKGEALRLLRTNSSEITFEENKRNFSTRFKNRDYPAATVERHLSEVIFVDRKKALEQRNKNASKKILPFVTQYHPACPTSRTYSWGNGTLYRTNHISKTSLRNLRPFHIAKENP